MNDNLKNDLYKLAREILKEGNGVKVSTQDEILEIRNGNINKAMNTLRNLFTLRFPDIIRIDRIEVESVEDLPCIHANCEECENWNGEECTGIPEAPKKPPKKTKGVSVGEITLTDRQVQFIQNLPNEDTYSDLDHTVYTDDYANTLELMGIMGKMSCGGIITTLRQKGILTTGKRAVDKGIGGVYFEFTDFGREIARQLGLK